MSGALLRVSGALLRASAVHFRGRTFDFCIVSLAPRDAKVALLF